MTSVLACAKDPGGKNKPLMVDATGNLRVNASLSMNTASLATTANIASLSTAITDKLNSFSSFHGADTLSTKVDSFYTTSGILLDEPTFSPGAVSSVANIEGCAHVSIFYKDQFAPTDIEVFYLGLFVELSPQTIDETSKIWHCHEIKLMPTSAISYPGIEEGRMGSIEKLYVGGYKSLRLRHELATLSEDPGDHMNQVFTNSFGSFVGSAV